MELTKHIPMAKYKSFFRKIDKDNLFVLSSSISFYSAVAIAPFLLIILGTAALVGKDIQERIILMAFHFSPQVGDLFRIIFTNVNKGMNISSISGMIGFFVLLLTSSVVFVQLRYSFDVIYGYLEERERRSIRGTILSKLLAMLFVFLSGVFLIISSSLPGIIHLVFSNIHYEKIAIVFNVIIYIIMFWGIHYFSPTFRPLKKEAFKMSLLSSVFFMLGNSLIGFYFKNVATTSIHGAAGSLLVFLVWTYYSSFTLFLSAEVFIFFNRNRR
jgi:membrane protein